MVPFSILYENRTMLKKMHFKYFKSSLGILLLSFFWRRKNMSQVFWHAKENVRRFKLFGYELTPVKGFKCWIRFSSKSDVANLERDTSPKDFIISGRDSRILPVHFIVSLIVFSLTDKYFFVFMVCAFTLEVQTTLSCFAEI